MSYYFFLGETMLPVPPAKLSVKIKNKNKTVNLINEGEINIIKTPGLTEISFDVLLPNQAYPFANYDSSLSASLVSAILGKGFSFQKADHFLDTFEQAKAGNTPLRLIISRMRTDFRMLFDTNMLVTIEEYETRESHEDGFDVVVPLRLKQYRPYATKECEVTKDENGKETLRVKETRPAYDKTVPAVYRIRNEQSVCEAVRAAAGGRLNWRSVMGQSGIGNPLGYPGVVLHLGR